MNSKDISKNLFKSHISQTDKIRENCIHTQILKAIRCLHKSEMYADDNDYDGKVIKQ